MQMIAERLAAPLLLRQKQIQAALAVMERLLERVHDAFFVRAAQSEAVDHDLQGVGASRRRGQFAQLTDRLIDRADGENRLAQDRSAPRSKPPTNAAVETSRRSAEPSANSSSLA